MNIKHRIRNFSFFCFIIAVAILNALPQDGKSNSSFTDTKERFENKGLTRSETPVECFSYEEDEDGEGIVIIGYHGIDKNVVIPATINGMPVVALGYNDNYWNGVFEDCTDLTSVAIPSSVRVIGCNAFAYCTSLKEIIIPEGVDEIGCDAFWGCSSLVSITIPKTVKILASEEDALYDELYDETFGKCISLESIVVDSDNEYFTSVDGVLFTKDMETLLQYPSGKKDKHYVVPEGVEEIGESAFYYCKNLEAIVIPEGMMYIGDWAFEECRSLVSVNIPASIEEIGTMGEIYVFSGCKVLEMINVAEDNENYVSVDGVLFTADMTKLILYPPAKKNANYDVPDDVESIGTYAFEDNPFLQTVTIPEGVAEIGGGVFYNCTSLRRVSFPSTLVMGENAWDLNSFWQIFFGNCLALEAVDVAEGNESYTSCDGVLFTADMTTLILYPPAKQASAYTIPATVEEILESAFWMCKGLEAIEVEDGNEKYVAVDGVLYQSNMNTLVRYPAGKKNAVYVVPATVNSIDVNALRGCINLTRIEVEEGNESFVSVDGVLFSKDMKTLVCYPAGRQNAEYTVPEGVASIDEYAFYGCEALMTVTLPNSLSSIGNDAFTGCQRLADMVFLGPLPNIHDCLDGEWDEDCNDVPTPITFHVLGARGWDDFSASDGLTVIIAEDNIDNEFEYETVDGGITITRYIGKQVNVYVPSSVKGTSVTAIGDRAFADCNFIKKVVAPYSVISIGDLAFAGCIFLENFEIFSNVKSLGIAPFMRCFNLRLGCYSPNYVIEGKLLLSKDKKTLVQYLCEGDDYNEYAAPVEIPDYVENIGAYAFAENGYLHDVLFSQDSALVTIGDHAFDECWNLRDFEIPAGVRSIGAYAFAECEEMSLIELSENVETIGMAAFLYCRMPESLYIPATVTFIGDGAFASNGGDDFSEIIVDEANEHYVSVNGILFTKDEKRLVQCPYAWIPLESYEDIDYAIPSSVTAIGAYAFCSCYNLVSVLIPESVREIGRHAFYESAIQSVVIPKNVAFIGDAAFACCLDLNAIDVDSANATYTSVDGVLFTKNMNTLLQYPYGKWPENGRYDIPDGVEKIAESAFEGCFTINELGIPESVSTIGDYAFYTDSINTIVFYGGVPSFGKNWHYSWKNMTISVPADRGWEDWEVPEGVTVTFRESFSLVLRKGWNLCAMPFIPDERCVARLKGIGDCWGWVASRNCRLETIRQGQGFWLYSDKEQVVEVSGEFAENTDDYDTEYRRGSIASTSTAVLKPGWNLVGKGFAGELTETSNVWTVENEILTRMKWTTEGYVLKPGTGYWIFIP